MLDDSVSSDAVACYSHDDGQKGNEEKTGKLKIAHKGQASMLLFKFPHIFESR